MLPRHILQTALFLSCGLFSSLIVQGGEQPDQSTGASSQKCDCAVKCSRSGQWFVVETDNFQAYALDSQASARLLAETAESLRHDLQMKWLGTDSSKLWNPKCQIVLHPNVDSYVAACGRGSEHTVGTSLFKTEEGQIGGRRIDLLGGRADFLSAALPHELTHVVLKDRFPATTMPRWADEGAAILADNDAKQGRHLHDLETALAQHTTFPAAKLLTMDDYPLPDQIGTFYGQSASVTEFLVSKETPSMFVNFVQLAAVKGYDAALRQCYGISNAAELDRLWQKHVDQTVPDKSLPVVASNLAAR
jgi:hypothetical protein